MLLLLALPLLLLLPSPLLYLLLLPRQVLQQLIVWRAERVRPRKQNMPGEGATERDSAGTSAPAVPGALRGGMPRYKYVANRFLTATQNLLSGAKLSEYHTGYRAFTRSVLEELPLLENSDDFVFDNQMLAQILKCGYQIGEISCPTAYFEEASSINFSRSVTYGLGVLGTSFQLFLHRKGIASYDIFADDGRRLKVEPTKPGDT